ncbi:MAG: peptidylprolyl isomerase [Longimicrobiales bacterium]|nr:peptidylprolyl isomerase [Longimicrobiales bacterium]
MKRYLALALVTTAVAGCDAMTAHTDTVARAGDLTLTVEETADLLTPNASVPGRPQIVRSVADLWVDYALLASLVGEDSTLSQLDLDPLLRPYVEQQMFIELRGQVMTTDTVISEEELQELYATRGPDVRVKARHILLSIPDEDEGAQDSVRELARELRDRAAAGEDFSALARQYSDDSGTAPQGGDLGWFERGDMVAPFEESAFNLAVGEVSEVVETPFGLHIIKVEDREVPSLEDAGEEFRRQLINERRQASLTEYVESVRSQYEMEVREGATDVARDMADSPAMPLQNRAASRELVTWEGGALTAGELARLFTGMPMQERGRYTSLTDQQMSQLLRDVATNELIMEDAADRGITVPESERDSVRSAMRQQVVQVARESGFVGPPQEDETPMEAQERRLRTFFEEALSGQRRLMPLGGLSYALRQQEDWRLFESGIAEAAERIEERRAPAAGGADTGVPSPTGEAPPSPDTTG